MLPGGGRGAHALAVVARGGRHHLRGAGGPGPKRHEAADRLFQRQPPGLLHVGHVRRSTGWASQGGVLQMVNHGLSTGGLFALVGMIYERYHTRQIADLGGLAQRHAALGRVMFVFMALSSIGLPGLNGFAGEFLILLGMFQRAWAAWPDAVGRCSIA